ncbi:MAG: isopentenyl pyrophosphate isomerase [Moorea sp. SIO4A3]|nr:isopentenyl pyrophosphate isomerase [Moorena sp. SIO4A3]
MGRWGDGEMGRWGDGEMGRWGDLTGVGFLHLGKTWDEPEGEEKKNNEQAMQRGHGGNPHDRAASRQ